VLLLLLSWRARQALPIWGDKNVPERWGIPPDSESGGICLSLVIVDSHFIDWGHHSRAAVVAHSWRIVNRCQMLDVDGCQMISSLSCHLRKVTIQHRCWSTRDCCRRRVKWNTSARDWDHNCQDDSTNIQTSRRRRPTDYTVSAHFHHSSTSLLLTAHINSCKYSDFNKMCANYFKQNKLHCYLK